MHGHGTTPDDTGRHAELVFVRNASTHGSNRGSLTAVKVERARAPMGQKTLPSLVDPVPQADRRPLAAGRIDAEDGVERTRGADAPAHIQVVPRRGLEGQIPESAEPTPLGQGFVRAHPRTLLEDLQDDLDRIARGPEGLQTDRQPVAPSPGRCR